MMRLIKVGCITLVAVFALYVAVFALYVCALLTVIYNNRVMDYVTEKGTCPDYECFAEVLRHDGRDRIGGLHEGALSQVPKGARDIHYFFRVRGWRFELRFHLDEDEFMAWAESLGWPKGTILASRNKGFVTLDDAGVEERPKSMEFESAYSLYSYGPHENATHGINQDFRVRKIVYDLATHTIYLEFWTPLPDKMRNER